MAEQSGWRRFRNVKCSQRPEALVFREEYYLAQGSDAERARLGDAAGKAEVHIAKNRHGPTGTAHLRFDGPTTSFSDVPDVLLGISRGVAADADADAASTSGAR